MRLPLACYGEGAQKKNYGKLCYTAGIDSENKHILLIDLGDFALGHLIQYVLIFICPLTAHKFSEHKNRNVLPTET